MIRAYKFRLEPNANQLRELDIAMETHRRLYNTCLEQRKIAYKTEKRSIGYFEQCAWFTVAKKENKFFQRINRHAACATMRRLDKSFQAFFRRVKAGQTPGYPRFKAQDRFNSFTYPSIGNGARVLGNKLRLQNIGLVRINLHRDIEGVHKTITVSREAGKWFVIVACELPAVAIAESDKSIIGLDVGLQQFVTDSEGNYVAPLQPLKPILADLRREQRSLSRKVKGGSNRRKHRTKVATLHAKVANTRRDQHHKIAAILVNRSSGIVVESLNIKGMLGNHKLARAISDAGWNSFLMILKHKAESAGVQYMEVDARYTSQTCPVCGNIAKKSLSERMHRCECGYSAQRDHAAAQVILARGMLAGMRPVGLNAGDGSHGPRSHL